MDNNFQVDTSKQVKKDFLKKTEIPLGIAFLLTGIETVAAILFFIITMKKCHIMNCLL